MFVSRLTRMHDASSRALFMLACMALVLACALYLYEVAARYMFNAPTTWSGEVVSYALAGLIFLALPDITRRQGHIAIDIALSSFPEKWSVRMTRLSDLAGAAACGFAAWIVWLEVVKQFERGLMTNAAHPIPRWWITAIIFVGLFSTALHFLRHGMRRP